MNTLIHPKAPKTAADSYRNTALSLAYSSTAIAHEEEILSYSTIDGGVIAYNAGTKAINNGAGIFIGDYFVGMSDSCQTISNMPFVRY